MAPSPESAAYNDIRDSDAKKALAEDKYDDCTACRVTGAAAFIGLGAYSYHTGMTNLRKQEQAIMKGATKYKMGSRKLGIITISASLVGIGIFRAIN